MSCRIWRAQLRAAKTSPPGLARKVSKKGDSSIGEDTGAHFGTDGPSPDAPEPSDSHRTRAIGRRNYMGSLNPDGLGGNMGELTPENSPRSACPVGR